MYTRQHSELRRPRNGTGAYLRGELTKRMGAFPVVNKGDILRVDTECRMSPFFFPRKLFQHDGNARVFHQPQHRAPRDRRQCACWVHRKGATRAFPAGHHALKGTPSTNTGHPILLPGNPQAGFVCHGRRQRCAAQLPIGCHWTSAELGPRLSLPKLESSRGRLWPVECLPDHRRKSAERALAAQGCRQGHPARFVIKDGDMADD